MVLLKHTRAQTVPARGELGVDGDGKANPKIISADEEEEEIGDIARALIEIIGAGKV